MTDNSSDRVLRLALLGDGKMGKFVAQLASSHGFEVSITLNEETNAGGRAITPKSFAGIDVAIDFTAPNAVVDNVRRVAALGCNLVVGTTGWHDRIEEVREIVIDGGVGLVYGANFSVGAQLFFRTAEAAASIFAGFSMYEAYIAEAHHRFKKDAPSGTALELKRRLQPALGGREIPVASVRGGYIPGTHELGFDSEADTVIVRHTARGRQGFAEGALFAARWVMGRKGTFAFAELFESPETAGGTHS